MESFISFCTGIVACIAVTVSGEREYGRMMYRRGYSQAMEDMKRKQERKLGD